jgi:hypothetical protein
LEILFGIVCKQVNKEEKEKEKKRKYLPSYLADGPFDGLLSPRRDHAGRPSRRADERPESAQSRGSRAPFPPFADWWGPFVSRISHLLFVVELDSNSVRSNPVRFALD